MDRRALLQTAGVAALVSAVGAGGLATTPKSAAAPVMGGLYRSWVPEIFAPQPDPPDHSEAIVIGSGFGGAVTALRLAQAGTSTTVLERGSRWPTDPWREIFTNDEAPDGRGFWHRTSFTGVSKVPIPVDPFGGVLDVTQYPGVDVWRGAAVGGGSVIFTGCMIAPPKNLFDQVFRGVVNYDELDRVYYPRVRKMLRLSPVPADIYASEPFTHCRQWDDQVRRAGYQPTPSDSIFNWDVIRQELSGKSRQSATVGRSNLGNSNGAKFDLNQNYLRDAQATGKSKIFPGQRVDSIGQDAGGKYTVHVSKIDPDGKVSSTRTLTCDRLFLAAGSIGTSELLVRAQATGTLPHLNEHIGDGWGTNGDVALARGNDKATSSRAAPSVSRILDQTGPPVTLENWYAPGLPLDIGLLASLGMVLDPTRAKFGFDKATGNVGVSWPLDKRRMVEDAAHAVDKRVAERAGAKHDFTSVGLAANSFFTAHPLGGAVLGQATDGYGRVQGHSGLYVMDGAMIPGSTATANPSLTISAIAERNIENIIHAGK